MDLDVSQKVVQLIGGILPICGALYAFWKLFLKKVDKFVRGRTRSERRKQGKQCPRCHSLQGKQASHCRGCGFQFTFRRQRRGGRR